MDDHVVRLMFQVGYVGVDTVFPPSYPIQPHLPAPARADQIMQGKPRPDQTERCPFPFPVPSPPPPMPCKRLPAPSPALPLWRRQNRLRTLRRGRALRKV